MGVLLTEVVLEAAQVVRRRKIKQKNEKVGVPDPPEMLPETHYVA